MRGTAILACALLLAACAHVAERIPLNSSPLVVMTYNVRLDLASDGANAWPKRKDMVAALIGHEAPDILGMQEVLAGQKHDLEEALPSYRFIGVGRDDGGDKGEFSPLAWRNDRFVLVDWGNFWLSETPANPGKGWDAAYPRIATWALLRERGSGRPLRVLNTHFDNVGEVARERAAEMIVRWAREGQGSDLSAATVVMGDFNVPPGSRPHALLADAEHSGLKDAKTLSTTPPYGPSGTFTGFDISKDAGEPIDHIFVSSGIRVRGYSVVTQHWGGWLPSDHYPVIVELQLPDR